MADAGVDLKSSWLWWLAKTKAPKGGGRNKERWVAGRIESGAIPLADLIPCQAVH